MIATSAISQNWKEKPHFIPVIFFWRKFEKYDFKQRICIEKMTQIRQISKEKIYQIAIF